VLSKDIPTEPEGAAVAPADLVGFDFPHVLKLLRRPDMIQNSALSIVWTYAQSDCTLQLYFAQRWGANSIYIQTDGEAMGVLPATVSTIPNALTLLMPKRYADR